MTSSTGGNDGTEKGGAKKPKRRATRSEKTVESSETPVATTAARSENTAESSETPVATTAAQADATPVDGGARTRGFAIAAIAFSVVILLVAIGAGLRVPLRATARLDDRMLAIDSRMLAIDNGMLAIDNGMLAIEIGMLAIGVTELRKALGGPEQYEDAMRLLYKLAPADEQVRAVLKPIEPAASAGIPTIDQLGRRLSRVAVGILVAETVPPSNNRWVDRALVNLASAVSLPSMVRQLDGHGPASETALRAQDLMRRGDLEGAVAEVGTLSGRAAQLAAPWLTGARDRLAAMRALEALDDLIEKRLSFKRP